MPVKKFRSVEEMDASRSDLWCDEPDADYFKRVDELWQLSSRVGRPGTRPRGVFKFHSLEEAQAHRDGVLGERVRELWRERLDEGKLRIVQRGADD